MDEQLRERIERDRKFSEIIFHKNRTSQNMHVTSKRIPGGSFSVKCLDENQYGVAEFAGKFIIKTRRKKGETQETLADRLNISSERLSFIERGLELIDTCNLMKICSIYDLSPNDILGYNIEDIRDQYKTDFTKDLL
jgi:DNA-binding Xre family transcriptional regulator